MKAYVLHNKVHEVLSPNHPAYGFPPESWSPTPEALFSFEADLAPWVKAQETPFDTTRQWFDAAYLLLSVKTSKVAEFKTAFDLIEDKRARSVATVTEFMALDLPLEEYAEDLNILGQINMVAEENRLLLAELESLSIPEDATLEEAQSIIRKAMDILPWMPPLPWTESGGE